MHVQPTAKTILVTGASSGIGYELARGYLLSGDKVFVMARSGEALARLVTEFPVTCVAIPVDLANAEDAQRAGALLAEATNYLDLALLNAGTCEYVDVQHFSRAPFEPVTAVNWWGTIHSLQFCLPLLRKAAALGRRPQLVGISSMAALLPMPRSQAYGASKVALEYLLNSMRVDMAAEDIHITLVRPGFVKTPLTDRNDFAMPWLMSAEEAATKIAAGITARRWLVQFPWPLVGAMKLVAILPLKWQVSLLRKLSRTGF